MAVIELDTGPAPAPATRPPIRLYRPAALAAAVLLLFLLGGSAPATPVMWNRLGSIPLTSDGSVAPAGDRIVTIGDGAESREVTAWTTDPPRRLWTTTVEMAEPDADVVVVAGYRLLVLGDTVLVARPDYRTAVLDLATGRTRFIAPARIETVAAGIGVTRETEFRPGAEYDQSSGDAGPLYLSADGRPYREPPRRTFLIGVDLTGGREVWRRPAGGWSYTSVVAGGLLVVAGDRIQLLDPATGRVLRERAGGGTWADVIGGTAVVQEDRRTVGYDVTTLEPRWTTPDRLLLESITGARCDGVICRRGPRGVGVVDPATGALRWETDKERSLRSAGGSVVEYDGLTQQPVRAVDAATGRTTADLTGWHTISPVGALLSRVEPGGKRMSFALLRAGTIQPLGYAGSMLRDCRAGDGLAVCRDDDGVELFAYRGE